MLVWAIALTSYFVHRTRTLRLRRIVAIHWWSLRLIGIRQWAGTTYVTSGATFATRINPRTRVSVFMFEFPYLCGRLDWTDVVFCVQADADPAGRTLSPACFRTACAYR
jgi:hypothetical protein